MLGAGFHPVPEGHVAVVVTYLEMTARPQTQTTPALPPGVSFRRVQHPDASWYRDLFARVGSADWLWSERLRLAPDTLTAILHDDNVEVYTLEKDGRAEALLELDFRTPGDCELAYFGLTPALIGTGAGRFLMTEAITRAWDRPGITRFHVHTCTADSPQALAFYRRSGFTAVRRAVEIAPDPRLDGTLPRDSAAWFPII